MNAVHLFSCLIASLTVGGFTDDNVLIANQTGLAIARIEIDSRTLEGTTHIVSDKILVQIAPGVHRLKIVFRGGADVEWPKFDFTRVRELILERLHNKISAKVE